MDLTHEQIAREFERQVHLCSGLGEAAMVEAVRRYFRQGEDPAGVLDRLVDAAARAVELGAGKE